MPKGICAASHCGCSPRGLCPTPWHLTGVRGGTRDHPAGTGDCPARGDAAGGTGGGKSCGVPRGNGEWGWSGRGMGLVRTGNGAGQDGEWGWSGRGIGLVRTGNGAGTEGHGAGWPRLVWQPCGGLCSAVSVNDGAGPGLP